MPEKAKCKSCPGTAFEEHAEQIQGIKYFNCGEVGTKPRRSNQKEESRTASTPLSAKIQRIVCDAITSRMMRCGRAKEASSLFVKRTDLEITLLGRRVTVLMDTGPEVSILPVECYSRLLAME